MYLPAGPTTVVLYCNSAPASTSILTHSHPRHSRVWISCVHNSSPVSKPGCSHEHRSRCHWKYSRVTHQSFGFIEFLQRCLRWNRRNPNVRQLIELPLYLYLQRDAFRQMAEGPNANPYPRKSTSFLAPSLGQGLNRSIDRSWSIQGFGSIWHSNDGRYPPGRGPG